MIKNAGVAGNLKKKKKTLLGKELMIIIYWLLLYVFRILLQNKIILHYT